MTQTNQSTTTIDPLMWVRFHHPNASPWWASIPRLLKDVPQINRTELIQRLRGGELVVFQASQIRMQQQPMPDEDQHRLKQLLAYEQGGFLLSTFEQGMALFYHPLLEGEFYSMNELSERGCMPMATITVNPLNKLVTGANGQLLDVFVPVGQAKMNFTLNSTSPC